MKISSLREFDAHFGQRAPIAIRKFLVLSLLLTLWQSVTPADNANAVATATAANGTTITNTYTDTTRVETFTVPANVTSMTMTVNGAGGGGGGRDSSPSPTPGITYGVVSGTFAVTPGQVISIGVGSGGSTGQSQYTGTSLTGLDSYVPPTFNKSGGTNPFGGYSGGWGGSSGPSGTSGGGGGGGAASVVKIGTLASPASFATIVGGGGGGQGGSGNPCSVVGQVTCLQGGVEQKTFVAMDGTYPSTFSPLFLNGTGTGGQNGMNVEYRRLQAGSGYRDGGGGGAGGGGARGGSRGTVEFGTGSYLEWFGKVGGSPGENSTSGISGLTASYTTLVGNYLGQAGSVVISYDNGNPSPPLTPNGTPGNAMVHLYWGIPVTPGASAITTYSVEYSVSPFSTWTNATNAATTNSFDITSGLVNGTTYKFRVAANNSNGKSSWALSPELTPNAAPTAPTITSVTRSDGALSVAFTAVGIGLTFGVSSYQFSVDTGTTWTSINQNTSPILIKGLTNGRQYAVQIRAISPGGTGAASTTVTGTPSTVPGGGVILSATTTGIKTYTNGYTGGSAITSYVSYKYSSLSVCTSDGGYSYYADTLPTTVYAAQPAGTAWRYAAVNANGTGAFSNCLVSSNTPSIPTSVVETLTAQVSAIQVGWSASINDGPINKVEYSLNSGSWVDAGTISNPFVIRGLTNGSTYGVRTRVTNSAGTSAETSSQNATPNNVPDAPLNPLAVAAAGGATVYWEAPISNGGSSITSYTASAYTALTGGSVAGTACTTATTTCVITGLSNASIYYYSVVATNSIGSSVATSPRVQVQPAALPGAPSITGITVGDRYLGIAFTAGSADVNAPIVSYKYSLDNGTTWNNASGSTSPLSASGLTNGTIYTVKIRAVAANGDGTPSASATGKPYGQPDAPAPATISYIPASGRATISWVHPFDNGDTITVYTVSAFSAIDSGSLLRTCPVTSVFPYRPANSCVMTGLTNGTPVYISIESRNQAGNGPRSNPRVRVVSGTATTTTLSVSPLTQSTLGKAVTLTATVGSGGSGTVNFKAGGTSISGCSAVTVTSAVATCSTSSLTAGVNVLSAEYSGGGAYSSSLSANQNYTINGAVTETATVTTLNVVNGFTGVDTITASGGTGNKTLTLSVSPSSAGITINTATLNTAILNVANNVTPGTYTATITATDSVTATGTINVTINVSRSAVSSLTGLSLSNGLGISFFLAGTLSYTVAAANETTTANITATWSGYGETATATFSGTGGGTYPLTSGTALTAYPVALSVGANLVTIKTYAQDGTSTSYTITITRAGATVSALTGLTFTNSVALNTSFVSGTTSYTSTVPYETSTTQVTGTWVGVGETATATFGGNTYPLTSGAALTAYPIALTAGGNTVVTITGYAQNGTSTPYTVTIARTAAATVSALTGLTFTNSVALNTSFVSGTTSYTSTVPYTTSSTQVTGTWAGSFETATATFGGSTYLLSSSGTILGTAIPLTAGGDTVVTITGYAQNGTSTPYTVTITRAAVEAVSALSGLTFTNSVALNTSFVSGTTSYTSSVPYTTSSTQVTGTWAGSFETATATFGGSTYLLSSSGTILGTAIPLLAGVANVVTITGYAQNGTSTPYTVTITRAAVEAVSALSGLTFTNSVALNTSFVSGTTAYTSTVPYTTSSTQVTGSWAGSFETATATFGGSTYLLSSSGTILGTAIALTAGANTVVTITGYAQNGTSTPYTVTITRTAAATTSAITAISLANSSIPFTFDSTTVTYSLEVPLSTTTTSITASWAGLGETATVTFPGIGGITYPLSTGVEYNVAISLAAGLNTILVKGFAQNGTSTTYTLNITRTRTILRTPTAPSLSAPAGTTTSMTVNYSESQVLNTSVYRILLYRVTGDSLTATIEQSYTNSGLLTFSSLAPSTAYYAKVIAIGSGNYDNSAASAASTSVSTNALPTAPVIATPPASTTITSGNTTDLSVSATRDDLGTLSYQWESATVAGGSFTSIAGATDASYRTPSLTVANSGIAYRVKVYNTKNGAISAGLTSSTAVITVSASVLLTPTAPSLSAPAGTTTSMTVNYSESQVLNTSVYRILLYRVTGDSLTATIEQSYTNSGLLTFSSLAPSTAYYAKVIAIGSGNYGNSVASAASTSVSTNALPTAPVIATQPASTTITSGNTTDLSVSATRDDLGTLSYQWESATVAGGSFTSIAGATDASYRTPSLTVANSGIAYRVKVYNTKNGAISAGLTSSTAVITVSASVLLTPTAPSLSAPAGTTTSMTVNYSASQVLNTSVYRILLYRVSGDSLTATIEQSYTNSGLLTFSSLAPSTAYYAKVIAIGSGNYGNSAASGASTSVSTNALPTAPVIATPPASTTITSGNTTDLSVSATRDDLGTLSYQWESATVAGGSFASIAGATDASYRTPSLTVANSGIAYRVKVYNTKNGAISAGLTSSTAVITVSASVLLTPTAPSLSAPAGTTTSMTVNYSESQVLNTSVYRILLYRVTGDSLTATIEQSYTNSGLLTFSSLAPSTAYYAKVIAIGSGNYGNSAASGASTSVSTNALPTAPVIATQPASTTITSGNTTDLSVSATRDDLGTLSYQWESADSAGGSFTSIAGATDASYRTPSLTVANSGIAYRVKVYNTKNGAISAGLTSSTAVITVSASVLLTPTAPSLSAPAGTTTSMTVNYSESQVLNTSVYRILLYRVTGDSLTATIEQSYTNSGLLTFSSLAPSTAYYAKVIAIGSGNYGNSAASGASTSVSTNALPTAPVIATQPASTTITSGNTTDLSVSATRDDLGTLSYQWESATVAGGSFTSIAGATDASYRTPSLTVANSGIAYRVKVYNTKNGAISAGLTSSTAVITVSASVLLTPTAPSLSAPAGTTTSMTVNYSESQVLNTSVYRILLYRVTGDSLTATIEQSYTNSGLLTFSSLAPSTAYYAKVIAIGSGNYGNSAASGASTSVSTNALPTAPVIATQPASTTITSGNTTDLSVSATRDDLGTLSYQWESATVAGGSFTSIAGATDASYRTPSLTVANSGIAYRVKVYNTKNGAISAGLTSSTAVITVSASVLLTPTAPSLSAPAGTTTSMTVNYSESQVLNTSVYRILLYRVTGDSLTATIEQSYTNSGLLTFSSLAPSTAYYAKVIAIGSGNYGNSAASGASTSVSTNALPTAPVIATPPASTTITSGNTTDLSVSATRDDLGTLSYQWESADSAGGSFTSIAGATDASYRTPSLTVANSGIAYRVKVYNTKNGAISAGLTSSTAVITVSAITLTTPTAPSGSPVDASSTSISVTYSPVANATQYEIKTYTVSGDNLISTTTNTYSTGIATISGLNSNTAYYTKIIAVGSGNYNNSALSNSSSTIQTNVVLGTPTLSASATSETVKSMDLSWAAAISNADSYTVNIYDSSGTNLLKALTVNSGATTSLTVTASNFSDIADNTNYMISITTVGSGRYLNSSESSKISVTTNSSAGSITISSQPENLYKVALQTANFSATVSANGVSTYQWEYSSDGTTWQNVSGGSGATTNSYTTPSLTTSYNSYKYRVRITNTKSGTTSSEISDEASLYVIKAEQSPLTLTTPQGRTTADLVLRITGGSSGGALTYDTTSEGCTLTGSTLRRTTVGDCVITVTRAGNDSIYNDISWGGVVDFIDGLAIMDLGFTGGALEFEYQSSVTITLGVGDPGKVQFLQDGRPIPGCNAIRATVLNPAQCIWKPSTFGQPKISAVLTPNNTANPTRTSAVLQVRVYPRT